MKHCRKLPEPTSLAAYRAAQPDSTWDEMRNDPHHGGQQAYLDIKSTLVCGQRGLCAFCERLITVGLGEVELDKSRTKQRVEHFHPKSDVGGAINWALHWPNLWAVCTGGNQAPPRGEPADPAEYLPPPDEHLSCDAFKGRQIETGKLALNPEGWILAPNQVPAFPRLFKYTWDGAPEPDDETCATHVVAGNQHADTVTLVAETIKHLNLGCVRLNRLRYVVRQKLSDMIARIRMQNPRVNPQECLFNLARRLLSEDPNSVWAEFFTLIRWRLGEPAERRLHEIEFAG